MICPRCPRCAKDQSDIHTCAPSDFVRKLEAEIAALRADLKTRTKQCAEVNSLRRELEAENATLKDINESARRNAGATAAAKITVKGAGEV